MNRAIHWKQSIIVLLTFLVAVYGRRILLDIIGSDFDSYGLRLLHYYLWWLIPVIIVSILLFGKDRFLEELGLTASIKRGFSYAFLMTLPMFLGYALFGEFNDSETLSGFVKGSILPGFMEELLFRAFLFGLLFIRFGWGFLPSGLIGAFIFGLQHLYQGDTLMEALGVFGVTFAGALWFAWLYIEWDKNLWLVIFLHSLMNLYWSLFDVSESGALGGQFANTFRVITIVLSVYLTIRLCKARHRFDVNKTNLFSNH